MLHYNTVNATVTPLPVVKFETLRELEEERNVTVLKSAIQAGIDCGIAENFNPAVHLERLTSNKRNNG